MSSNLSPTEREKERSSAAVVFKLVVMLLRAQWRHFQLRGSWLDIFEAS
jgi:hypothetical protein